MQSEQRPGQSAAALCGPRKDTEMAQIETAVEIDVPVTTAYNQWTQFEDHPSIMTGVEDVEQIDDTHLRWTQTVANREKSWEAEITEQIPDTRIAWQSTEGDPVSGSVSFTAITPTRCRVFVQINYEAEGMMEKAGSALGIDTARVKQDLNQFKEFLEERGHETGAWRGTVEPGTGQVTDQPASAHMGERESTRMTSGREAGLDDEALDEEGLDADDRRTREP
jgi:uncharacterized membrane protein